MRIGRRTKSLIHYHFIVFIFGFTSILGALISIDALYLVWLRMFIAAVSLGFFIVLTNRKAFLIQSKNRLQIVYCRVSNFTSLDYIFQSNKNDRNIPNIGNAVFWCIDDCYFRAIFLQT